MDYALIAIAPCVIWRKIDQRSCVPRCLTVDIATENATRLTIYRRVRFMKEVAYAIIPAKRCIDESLFEEEVITIVAPIMVPF